jgi:hypothetical protein
MPTIGWDEAAPANTQAASLGDDAIRSMKTNVAGGLGTSMYWPGTGGGSAASAGIMKPGAARAFYGTQSQVSAAQTGQLMLTSDTSRLYEVGPAGGLMLGSGSGVDGPSHPGTGVRWVVNSGVTVAGSGTTQAYGAAYVSIPQVVVSAWTTVNTGVFLQTFAYASGFSVTAYNPTATAIAASKVSVLWMSMGTVVV